MKIMVVFSLAFNGPAGDALWIVDSEANRHRFESLRGQVDANSAIFKPDAPALNMLWAAQKHHPNWTVIEAVGLSLSDEIAQAMSSEGRITCTDTGFQLLRNE